MDNGESSGREYGEGQDWTVRIEQWQDRATYISLFLGPTLPPTGRYRRPPPRIQTLTTTFTPTHAPPHPGPKLRKKGKMPNTISTGSYSTEYDTKDGLCLQRDAVKPGDRIALIDDLVATGGTLLEGVKLVQQLGGTVVEASCMVELKFLDARSKLTAAGVGNTWALMSEEVLTSKAEIPEGYVDDGAPH